MQRRDLMTMTGAALLLAGGRALAQSSNTAGTTEAKVVRIYATPDGGSRVYGGSGARAPDWHTAPRKQFAINMTGELEVELTDGTRRRIGSDLVYLEDLTGKGHVTRALGPITNVFLHVPDDFDVVAWAAGR
jgi:hypothetical protein